MPARLDRDIDRAPANILDRLVAGKPTPEDVAAVLIAMGQDIAAKTNRTLNEYLRDLRDRLP